MTYETLLDGENGAQNGDLFPPRNVRNPRSGRSGNYPSLSSGVYFRSPFPVLYPRVYSRDGRVEYTLRIMDLNYQQRSDARHRTAWTGITDVNPQPGDERERELTTFLNDRIAHGMEGAETPLCATYPHHRGFFGCFPYSIQSLSVSSWESGLTLRRET